MTNRDLVLGFVGQNPGLSDAEIRQQTGIEPHQQVNQICRGLAAEGLIDRRMRPDGRLGNYASGLLPSTLAATTERKKRWARKPSQTPLATPEIRVDLGSTLILIPCSSSKERGGSTDCDGRRSIDLLPVGIAQRLQSARREVAERARLDESLWLPAYRRYTGRLYRAAGDSISILLRAGADAAIISGGYGIVLADEPIGTYERVFKAGDWPGRVVTDAIPALASACGKTKVVGMFSSTTGYAKVFRRVDWPGGMRARLISPERRVGGAMVAAPEALGEMLAALTTGAISAGWTSGRGLGAELEVLA